MPYQYDPPDKFEEKDNLPPGSAAKKIVGKEFDDEFKKIQSAFAVRSTVLASCKFAGEEGGETVRYGYNVKEVIQPQPGNNGFERVVFENPINMDTPIQLPDGSYANPGDFAAVFTGYTTSNTMAIFSVTDQREAYIDVAIRVLGGNGTWEIPSRRNGFAMILVDQVPG
jgi:hypothetical protein